MQKPEQRDQQILEMLKQYPPELLLEAAMMSPKLPEDLKKEIRFYLGQSSEQVQETRGRIETRAEEETIEQIEKQWVNLINAYGDYRTSDNSDNIYAYAPSGFPPKRVGVINAIERAREQGRHAAQIQESSRGDFLVFTDSGGQAILPRPGIALNASRFEAGGWGDIFECRGVDFRKNTSFASDQYDIIAPAVVQESGGQVSILKKGILQFKT